MFGLCMHAVAVRVHVIMDIFIPTLCSTAADIARDVAGLRTVERAAADTHTHTRARTKTSTTTTAAVVAAVGRRRNVQSLILCCFFFHFVLLFILLLRAHCAHQYSYFIIHDVYNNNNTHNNIIAPSALSPSHSGSYVHADGLHTLTHTHPDRYTHTQHTMLYILLLLSSMCVAYGSI